MKRVVNILRKSIAGEVRLAYRAMDPARVERQLRTMLTVAEALAAESPDVEPDKPPLTREQTVALGTLFLLGMRAHLATDTISRSDSLCDALVRALERETGVDW